MRHIPRVPTQDWEAVGKLETAPSSSPVNMMETFKWISFFGGNVKTPEFNAYTTAAISCSRAGDETCLLNVYWDV